MKCQKQLTSLILHCSDPYDVNVATSISNHELASYFSPNRELFEQLPRPREVTATAYNLHLNACIKLGLHESLLCVELGKI